MELLSLVVCMLVGFIVLKPEYLGIITKQCRQYWQKIINTKPVKSQQSSKKPHSKSSHNNGND